MPVGVRALLSDFQMIYKRLLILRLFNADRTNMITLFDHLPFENAVSNTKWLKLSVQQMR